MYINGSLVIESVTTPFICCAKVFEFASMNKSSIIILLYCCFITFVRSRGAKLANNSKYNRLYNFFYSSFFVLYMHNHRTIHSLFLFRGLELLVSWFETVGFIWVKLLVSYGWNYWFHGVKLSVSLDETKCFNGWN